MKYTNNEAYFDVIEEVDAIIDKTGAIVSAEIQGRVRETIISFEHFILVTAGGILSYLVEYTYMEY